ncbi:MAG: hypothetical protein QOG18_853 [Microbacteriaceae bacterium]|jgi:uncharacterized protein YdeI (YjbR/CyaY-like superfamily)|nr:hypothetical protein [Microbacteriaceae bacterium]MDQ1526240.1 hypothetical protein [Microbacteriaceae bacterium]MDQ1607230.1 hypothetical protein [Microbacteriaceae bacterium]
MRFAATVKGAGKTATGIPVPEDVFSGLGPGRRHAVVVTIGDYSYRSTVAPYNGEIMLPLSAEHRTAAGVAAGDRIDVTLEIDSSPREVDVPSDLAIALSSTPDAARAFEALSYSNKRRHVLSIEGAKAADTRARRIEKTIGELLGPDR